MPSLFCPLKAAGIPGMVFLVFFQILWYTSGINHVSTRCLLPHGGRSSCENKEEEPMRTILRRAVCGILSVLLCLSLIPAAGAASGYDRPGQKLLALTFDDGPGPYSDSILDTLQKHNAKATFFLNGYKLWRYSAQVKRMADEGHQLANHTYNHPYLTKLSDYRVRQELDSTAQILTQITGVTGTGNTGFYLRPPYGSFNKRVTALAGVPVIWCTVDSGDWKYQSSARLVSYTGSVTRDGDIVVMHEIHKTTAWGLDALLNVLDARGFEMVTLEDLFWRRGITPQAGQVYYSARNTGVDRCPRSLWYDESKLSSHWAYASIRSVMEQGLMAGNTYGEFLPNFPLTRGMFVTMLGRLSGAEAEAPGTAAYSDVPAAHYAAPYAAWARETGVMTGTSDGTFQPDRPITRQELAAALARYARLSGAEAGDFSLAAYKDGSEIASWAWADVAFCSGLGLLAGGTDGSFRPKDTATRAMGAVVLDRLSELPVPVPEEPPAEPAENEAAEQPEREETDAPADAAEGLTA